MKQLPLWIGLIVTLNITPAIAQGITPTICKAITNKAERERCILRYSVNERKSVSDQARQESHQKAKEAHFQAQSKALTSYKAPKVTRRNLNFISFYIDDVTHTQYLDCTAYDARDKALYKERVRITPPRSSFTFKAPPKTYPNSVTCR